MRWEIYYVHLQRSRPNATHTPRQTIAWRLAAANILRTKLHSYIFRI